MRKRRDLALRVANEQRARKKKKPRSLLVKDSKKNQPRRDPDLGQRIRERPPRSQSLQRKRRRRWMQANQRSAQLTMLCSQSYVEKRFSKEKQALHYLNELQSSVKLTRTSLKNRRKLLKPTRRNTKSSMRSGWRSLKRKVTTLMMKGSDLIKKP